MTGKAEVDQIPFVFFCLLHIWVNKQMEFFQIRDPKNNVISQPDVIQCSIHFRNSG